MTSLSLRTVIAFIRRVQTISTNLQALLAATIIAALSVLLMLRSQRRVVKDVAEDKGSKLQVASGPVPLLKCIRTRRSIFPRSYDSNRSVSRATMERILEAAMWAPFHGPVPPWHFVVLGRKEIVEMQRMTISYYDTHFEAHWSSKADYLKWRDTIEQEIEGRWGAVSFMVGIVVRRQAGSKRMPEWEEAAATACAVQNMHLQASAQDDLACYWSSWHSAARDSDEMRDFLDIGNEDKCLGFFIVAPAKPGLKDRRRRSADKHLSVEWRDCASNLDSAAIASSVCVPH